MTNGGQGRPGQVPTSVKTLAPSAAGKAASATPAATADAPSICRAEACFTTNGWVAQGCVIGYRYAQMHAELECHLAQHTGHQAATLCGVSPPELCLTASAGPGRTGLG